jgi:hypothetical protein
LFAKLNGNQRVFVTRKRRVLVLVRACGENT